MQQLLHFANHITFYRTLSSLAAGALMAEIGRPDIVFTSLGLIILDEIHFESGERAYDVLGGSGTYATIGARLLLPSPNSRSRSIGLIVLAGDDFPEQAESILSSWEISLILRKSATCQTSRATLKYQDPSFGPKLFENTTPPLQVTPDQLRDSGLLCSQSFHLLSSPQLLEPQVQRLLQLRSEASLRRPLILWEPAPPSAKPENLQACQQAASLVDIFSPNHIEFAAFFGDKTLRFERSRVEELVSKFVDGMPGRSFKGIILIRSGEYGCLVCAPGLSSTWIPPYYTSHDSSKVVDPTGAGNAFLGAFACSYLSSEDVVVAAQYGAVASSIVLERTGAPQLRKGSDGSETWNGIDVHERLRDFQSRA